MPRIHRPFPATGILPPGHLGPDDELDLSARFCYFLDLNDWAPPPEAVWYDKEGNELPVVTGGLGPHKQNLYDNAKDALVDGMRGQLNKTDANGISLIQNAIEFLDQVAQNERRKEIAIVNQYARDLENSLPSILKGTNKTDIQKLIQQLNDFAAHPDAVNMDDFYEKLTICLNDIRSKAQNISDRIKQLLADDRTTIHDLMTDNLAFRFGSDTSSLLRNLIGLKTRNIENSFASVAEELVIDFITKKIREGKIDEHNIVAASVGVMGDFQRYLMQNQEVKKLFKTATTVDPKELKELFQKYEQSYSSYLYALENQTAQLQSIEHALEQNFGVRELTMKEAEERKKALKKNLSSQRGRDASYGQQVLSKEFPEVYEAIQNIHFIDWTATDENGKKIDRIKRGQIGFDAEIRQLIDNIGLKLEGHPAVDTITVNAGTLTGDINPDMTNLLLKCLKPYAEAFENFEKKQRQDALTDLREENIKMNKEAARVLKELDQLIKLPEGKELFIYHESLKLYTRIEEHKTDEFEGRELQILGALDRIYSMDNFGGLMLPDMDIMYNLALNLSDLAVGGANHMRQELEDYLSIFAGMLMFDDMANMAQELATNASKQLNYSNLKNIHMYRVNEIYLPGSMVLSYIYRALSDGLMHLLSKSGRAAHVKISVGGANKEIKTYLDSHPWGSHTYDISQWDDEREKIAQGTKLKIVFLASFSNLVRDLQKHFD